mgnify:CR=1 FL=1
MQIGGNQRSPDRLEDLVRYRNQREEFETKEDGRTVRWVGEARSLYIDNGWLMGFITLKRYSGTWKERLSFPRITGFGFYPTFRSPEFRLERISEWSLRLRESTYLVDSNGTPQKDYKERLKRVAAWKNKALPDSVIERVFEPIVQRLAYVYRARQGYISSG